MQLDANCGVLTALHDLLVQSGDEGVRVVPRVPQRWPRFSFDGIRTEGAFVIGADVEDRRVVAARVTSVRGGPLTLWHSLGDSWSVDDQPGRGPTFTAETEAGQRLILRRE